ncbi:Atxe2 family lasso peptide isopeptidase [Pseudoxanthomonas sp. JBR18]|uniref:Atxe2 family lasso peptide isopeptidase n=1 Tax=Pseudoxanthomonas sp. JBR18 TaxID=2969308 RepID=UPI002305F9D5|nr:Atxe2 family lasso peptide isopeptidase [Pseudoxanthomonas sp. JBR18]WCE06217.1 Atxe2 family lasso peptide isopeptidase [Pseudoxanthomonas sp. JBR18]
MTATSHAAVVSPRRLLEVIDLGNPVISPDGRQVAFRAEQASVERNTVDTTWYVQSLDGRRPPHRISDGGAPLREFISGVVLPSPAVWSPDGHWVYYRALIDGRISVWRAAADGTGAREVTKDPADVRRFVLASDGGTLRYAVGATREEVTRAEESEYARGVHIDKTINAGAGLFRSSLAGGRPATQRFVDDWFGAGPLLFEYADQWREVNLRTMTTRDVPASGTPPRAMQPSDVAVTGLPTPSKIAVNPGDGRIAVMLPPQPDDQAEDSEPRLALLPNRRSSQAIPCTDPLCMKARISDIRWRPGSDELLFTSINYRNGRAQEIHAWNVVTGAVRAVVLADGLVSGSQRYWDVPCATSYDALVCVAAEADRPPRLESIDLTAGERSVLFAPNKGLELDIASTAPARLIRWHDGQGREFTGYLYEARRLGPGAPPPLFVTFYTCYGFLRGGVGDEWPLASLAEMGIAALCINAIPDSSKDFAVRVDQGRAAVESAVAFLAKEGRIDGNRVGMGGLSYGAEVTMWTLANSKAITAASISSVSSSPSYYLFNSLSEAFRTKVMELWQLGTPEETPNAWRQNSPAYQLDRIHAPILFQLPEQEYRMTLEYLYPLIRRHQGDAYVFPDEPHIKFQPRHKLAVYERNLDWFRFWLQGYEDPTPEKFDQYRAWEELNTKGGHVDEKRHEPS